MLTEPSQPSGDARIRKRPRLAATAKCSAHTKVRCRRILRGSTSAGSAQRERDGAHGPSDGLCCVLRDHSRKRSSAAEANIRSTRRANRWRGAALRCVLLTTELPDRSPALVRGAPRALDIEEGDVRDERPLPRSSSRASVRSLESSENEWHRTGPCASNST